jgi:NitT/TauT family transport system substrate-binding protein
MAKKLSFILLPAAFILWLLAALPFVSPEAWAREPVRLTVVSYPARPPKLPLWLALDAGLFEKHGLQVSIKELGTSEELLKALGERSGDVYAATAPHIVSAIGDGADLLFIANTGYSVIKLLSRPDITRVEELKGKRIGTGESNSVQDQITRQALARLGLDPDKDVTLVPMGGGGSISRLNALLAGTLDATTSNEDNLFDLERRGEMGRVRVLADNESLKLFIGAGVDFAVRRSLLEKERGVVKSFLTALSEAIALARRDRSQADRVYTRYLNVRDPALLDFMYRTYVLGAIPERPFPKTEPIAMGLAEFGGKPGLKGKRIESLVDRSLLDELERDGFFARLYSRSKE